MKHLTDIVSEASQMRFDIAFNDFNDEEHLPIGVTILVDRKYAKEFDKFLKDEEGGIFAHAAGMDTEY